MSKKKNKNKNIDNSDINFGTMADLIKMVNQSNTKFDPILDHKEKQEFLANIKKIREENSNNTKPMDNSDINLGLSNTNHMADLVNLVNELNMDPMLYEQKKQEFLDEIKKIKEEHINNTKLIDNSDINNDLSNKDNMTDMVNESNFQSEPLIDNLIDNPENLEFIDRIKKFKNNNPDKQNNSVNFLNLGINFDPLSDKQDTREFIDKIKHKMKNSKPENIDNTQNSSDNKVKSSKKLKNN